MDLFTKLNEYRLQIEQGDLNLKVYFNYKWNQDGESLHQALDLGTLTLVNAIQYDQFDGDN